MSACRSASPSPQAGLRVGIYDTNQATLDRIAAGEMPFMETGADELLARDPADRSPGVRLRAAMIGRTDHLVVVIGTPVDEFLGPSMTIFEKAVNQIAPHLREGRPGRPAEHGLSGHHRLRDPAPRPSAAARSTSRSAPSASPRVTPSRSCASLPQIVGADDDRAAERAPRPCSGGSRQDDPDEYQGSRAGEALHQHLALHEVRGGQPVLHDRRPGRRRLHERPAGDPRGLPARRRTCPVRASPPGRACSRTRCSCRRSPATTSRWARPRCRSTRACPRTSSSALERRYGGLQGKTVGILGMAFKAESDDPRASLSYKLRKILAWAGARVLATDPYVQDDRLVAARMRPRRERHPRPRRTAQAPTAGCDSEARTSWTSGEPSARGSGSSADPRHRRRRLHRRLPRPGAARGRPRGRRARRLLEVRAPDQVVRRPSRATASSRATPRTPRSCASWPPTVDQVVASAAMIGGISYFHEFAYDLLAENERILASTFDAAIAAHRDGHLRADHRRVVVDGLRVGDGLSDARGRAADLAPADLDVRLPEARVRVLRQGRLGAVRAAVHDRPAVQLRRHRRAPGAARHGHHVAAT